MRQSATRLALVLALLWSPCPPVRATQDFSLDSASPEVPGRFDAADVVHYTGGTAWPSASVIGIPPGNDLDAASDGVDALPWDACGSPRLPGGPAMRSLFFSVTRASVGVVGEVVHSQAQGNGAAADRFRLDRFWESCPGPGVWQRPTLSTDAPGIFLTPSSPGPESDIDALDEATPSDQQRAHYYHGVYFSVAPGGDWGPADIVFQDTLVPGATPPPVVYATAAQLGLLPGDDIDALAVLDPSEDGTFDPGDIVYISLAVGSPSLGEGLTAADVLEVFPSAAPVKILDGALFGLGAGDDLDALTVKDPDFSIPCEVADPPLLNGRLEDWCHCGTPRVADRAALLDCGFEERVWWDAFQDGAINDLTLLATRQDQSTLYFALAWAVAMEIHALPLVEIAIDSGPGGTTEWLDPMGVLTSPGHCSVSTERACTSDEDCHFCEVTREPFPSLRLRVCGAECDFETGDVCDYSQTCVGVGTVGPAPDVGLLASPLAAADYLVVLDLSWWLLAGYGVQLLEYDGGTWTPRGEFWPYVPQNVIYTPERPAATVEIEIPWSAFGCTGCPDACICPGLGPGDDFTMTAMAARTAPNLDYAPDGPIEDVMSEPVAGTSTTTTTDCPGPGIGTTSCEISDGSADAFVPVPPTAHAGRVSGLRLLKDGDSLTLNWSPSCSAAAVDYEVYAGDLGSWSSHTPVPGLCSTGGVAAAVLEPAAGDRYYLVVPSDGSTEGSYGLEGGGGERPIGTSPCRAQSIGSCP